MFLRPWRNATRMPGCGLTGVQILTSVADSLLGGTFVTLTVAQLVLWASSNNTNETLSCVTSIILVIVWFSAALHVLFATMLEAALPSVLRGPSEDSNDTSSPLQPKVLARVHHLFYGDAHVAAACAVCLFVPLRDASIAEALSGRSSVINEFAQWAHLLAWGSWLLGLPLSAHQLSIVAWPLVMLAVVAGAPGSPCHTNIGALEASDDQISGSSSRDSSSASRDDDRLLGGLLVGCDLPNGNVVEWSTWTALAVASLCLLCLSSCCFAIGFSKKAAPKLKPPSLSDEQAQYENSNQRSGLCNRSQTTSASACFSVVVHAFDVPSPLSAVLLVALYPLPALLAFAFAATALSLAGICTSQRSSNSGKEDEEGTRSSGLRARASGGNPSRAVVTAAESTDSWAPTDVAASTSRDLSLVWPRLPDVESLTEATACATCCSRASSSCCCDCFCCAEAVSGAGHKFLWPLAFGPGTYRRVKCIAKCERPPNLFLLLCDGNDGNSEFRFERSDTLQREELVGALSERLRLPPPSASTQERSSSGGVGGGGNRNRTRSPHASSFVRSGSGGGTGKRGSNNNHRYNSSNSSKPSKSGVAKPLPAFFSSGAVRVPAPSKPKTPRLGTTTNNGGAMTPHRAPPSRLPSIGSFLHSPSAARTASGNHFFQFKPSKAHWQGMLNEPGEGGGGGRGGGGSMDSDGLRSPRNSFVLGSADGGALKQHSNHPHHHQRHHHAAFATKSPEPEIGRRYEEEDFEDKDEYYDDLNNSHYELTEAAQARDTATEATLWKHKISYHGHQLQPPPNTPNDKARASQTTATTTTDRKTRASRESLDSQYEGNGGGGDDDEDPAQLINDLTGRPVRESTESIGANTAAMKSRSSHRRRKSGNGTGNNGNTSASTPAAGSKQISSKGRKLQFKAAPASANEPGRVPTPMPQARTVKRSHGQGQYRAETYTVGDLRSPANATTTTTAQGGSGGKGNNHGGYEPTVWPESSSKGMRGGGGVGGTPLSSANKPNAAVRGANRSRAPNLVTIPAGTSMDARI